MKTHFIASILVISIILSSCNRDIPPVFEVYISFENADEYGQIEIEPIYIHYGPLDQVTRKPSGQGTLFFDREMIQISKENFSQKTFITSLIKSIGQIEYLSLESSIVLENEGISLSKSINKFNSVFPVEFEPENGEAYEVNFIIDIKNSLIKKDDQYYFELGGESKVVITKY